MTKENNTTTDATNSFKPQRSFAMCVNGADTQYASKTSGATGTKQVKTQKSVGKSGAAFQPKPISVYHSKLT